MKRTLRFLFVTFIVSTLISQPLFAKKPNARKGKYLFRKHCRSCHVDGGSASALSPISKTQAEWTTVFKEGGFQKLECKDNWKKRKTRDLNDMYAYMHDHAYDSPSPLKCK